MQRVSEQPGRDQRGDRAEQVAGWYFRLNGFLSIPGFVIHPDEIEHHPRTEADLLGVRFPYSSELLMDQSMEDDVWIRDCAKIHFIIAEVKASICKVNGPWSREEKQNMQRAIRRLGFAADNLVDRIAQTMYMDLHWEDSTHVLQYVAVGSHVNPELVRTKPLLRQITWEQIATFLFKRFSDFPQKLRTGGRVHDQWPDFGKSYGRWFHQRDRQESSVDALQRYIETGRCIPRRGD